MLNASHLVGADQTLRDQLADTGLDSFGPVQVTAVAAAHVYS